MNTTRAYEQDQFLSQPIGTADPKNNPTKVRKGAAGASIEIFRLPKAAANRNGWFGARLELSVLARIQGSSDAASCQHKHIRIGLHNDGEAWATLGTAKTDDYPGATLTDLAVTIGTSTGDLVVTAASASKAIEVYGEVRLVKMPATYDGAPEA